MSHQFLVKKVSLLFLFAVHFVSCLPEEPILLEDTAYITITFQHPKDSIAANEEILLSVAAYRQDNAHVSQDPSEFDFYDGEGNTLTYEQREYIQQVVRYGRWRGLKAATQKNGRLQPRQIKRPAEEVDMSRLIVW